MTFFKNLTLGLFSFLLFLFLTIFGILFMVKSTALNPNFVTGEINSLDVSSIIEDFAFIEAPRELPELNETINDVISSTEPIVKEQLNIAIHSVYDYLLGEIADLELISILRNTFIPAFPISNWVNRHLSMVK